MRGDEWLDVPAGTMSVEILHGPERKFEQRRVAIAAALRRIWREHRRGNLTVPGTGHW